MKNTTVLMVWVCLWIGQCLCNQNLPKPLDLSPHSQTWRPSHQHIATEHKPASSNNTLLRRRTLVRINPYPVPGVTESARHNTENTPQPVVSTNITDKIHNKTSRNNSGEGRVSPSVPPPTTSPTDPRHSAGENVSSVDSTTDKENQEGPQKDQHSDHDHEHPRESMSFLPAPDHTSKDMTDNLLLPQNTPAARNSEGVGREGHGRVTNGPTRPKDLCSFCLCDAMKKNVFCKHEHTNHEEIHELTLDNEVIPRSAVTLHIAGFERVDVKNNTFSRADLKLRKINFEDIGHLELVTRSLYFSSQAKQNMEVAVVFTNCNIPNMPQKTLTQLTWSDDPRQDINLEETRFLTLKFDGCSITAMRSYALYNARILNFNMTGTKVKIMEENSIHHDSYVGWIIEKSQLPDMVQKSICLRAQNYVAFSHNTFLSLGNRSLDILSSSQVLFEFNEVTHLRSEALMGIRPRQNTRAANIVFLNNTIAKADERSLLTSKLYPKHERKIINNKFNTPCDCNIMKTFEKLLGINSTSDYNNLDIFKTVTKKSLCQVKANPSSYEKMERYVTQYCTLPITFIVAGTTVGAVFLLLVIVCIVCTRRVKKAREEANYLGECCFSQSFSTLHSNTQVPMSSITGHPSQAWESTTPLQPWVVAVPEVKTYQETELNVAYEHTEPIKVSMRDSFYPELVPFRDRQQKTEMRSSCPFN